VGLCGGAITQIFVGFLHPDISDSEDESWLYFNLVAAITVLLATIVPSMFIEIRETTETESNVKRRVIVGYIILMLMGSAVITSALIEDQASDNLLFGFALVIAIVWASPLVMSWRGFDATKNGEKTSEDRNYDDNNSALPLLEQQRVEKEQPQVSEFEAGDKMTTKPVYFEHSVGASRSFLKFRAQRANYE